MGKEVEEGVKIKKRKEGEREKEKEKKEEKRGNSFPTAWTLACLGSNCLFRVWFLFQAGNKGSN